MESNGVPTGIFDDAMDFTADNPASGPSFDLMTPDDTPRRAEMDGVDDIDDENREHVSAHLSKLSGDDSISAPNNSVSGDSLMTKPNAALSLSSAHDECRSPPGASGQFCDSPVRRQPGSPSKISPRVEVRIQSVPSEKLLEYKYVHSNWVEAVTNEYVTGSGEISYHVDFADGRDDVVLYDDLIRYSNGQTALLHYSNPAMAASAKRKRGDDGDEWIEDESHSSPNITDQDEPQTAMRSRRQTRLRAKRSLRFPQKSSKHQSLITDYGDDEGVTDDSPPPRRSTRAQKLPRKRPPVYNDARGDDILSSGDDEEFMPLVTSDIASTKGRRPKARRVTLRRRSSGLARQQGAGSDIELEAPRRSVRSTRNQLDMQDDTNLDDESFYVVDNTSPATPKTISIREIFRPIAADTPFGSMHLPTCYTCGGSEKRGQFVYCQGCSLTFHKNCLGYRSAREHMATKVAHDDFVLQCKYCIGVYKKKDSLAPRYDVCQVCKQPGKACAAFSQKKTARQEEKLREKNEGIDPITPVPKTLINNSELVLFRCVNCHRGWHINHLPPIGNGASNTANQSDPLADYSVDWQCNECVSAEQKIHKLAAWRPIIPGSSSTTSQQTSLSFLDLDEDHKEYLVKWETKSYAHCAWKPGAWIFGVATAAMRSAFAKRDSEMSLLHYDEKDAIPEEYLTPEIILDVKMKASAPRTMDKGEDLASIRHIRQVLVKFQGLGYDEVVWDSPPSKRMNKEIHDAFTDAFYDYVEGKYFRHEPQASIRDRVRAYKNAKFDEVDAQPAGLRRGKLMGYQMEGLNWLLENYHRNRSVVLADEMGLGKTVQVIALVASLVLDKPRCSPFLIVVPNSTCPNWRREFKQWTPDLRVVMYHGGKESQDLAYRYELFPEGSTSMRAHAVIMSYDSATDPKTMTLFKGVQWVGLVVDEGQRLKNDKNLLYLALQSMKIPFRLLLTGTPLQNNKRDLFNLIQFIDDTQRAEDLDLEYAVLDKESLPKLHERIRPYFLRRTKVGVLKFLPPMAQIILPVSMSVLQEKLSKSIMAKNPQLIKTMFANSRLNKKERGSLNNILAQLRKCLCHPFVYSDAIEERDHERDVLHRNLVEASSKLILLEMMLPKLKERGHRVLIFSQFLQQLDIMEDFLTGMGLGFRRLDGQLSSVEKQRRIDAFNAPGSDLFAFLLSTRAGGVGINLATADTVIIMDPDFNPHQDIQALSRAHRIGQKKKVLCFQLVTKDSVEERIMQIGRKKMALDHALIESMDDEDMAGDDLESILKHGAQALFDENYQKNAIQYDSASIDKLLDRSQMEQAEVVDEASAEGQYTYAKVWANDKSDLEGTLDIGDDESPVPINASVWDRILAQREEEARREAEANQEILGRGGRRRPATGGYRASGAVSFQLPDGIEAEAESTDSDAYSGNESDGTRIDSPDEGYKAPVKGAGAGADAAAITKKADVRKSSKGVHTESQKGGGRLSDSGPNTSTVPSQGTAAWVPGNSAAKPNLIEAHNGAISNPIPWPVSRESSPDHLSRSHYSEADTVAAQPSSFLPPAASRQKLHAERLIPGVSSKVSMDQYTEAQLRIYIDNIHRSVKLSNRTKDENISFLLHRLRAAKLHDAGRDQLC